MLLNPKSLDDLRTHVLLSWLCTYIFNIFLLAFVSYYLKEFTIADLREFLPKQIEDLTLLFAPSMLILVGLWFVPAPAKVALTSGQRLVALALSWFFLASISLVSLLAALDTLNHCGKVDGIDLCKNAYQGLSVWQPVAFGPLLFIFGTVVGARDKSNV